MRKVSIDYILIIHITFVIASVLITIKLVKIDMVNSHPD